MSGPIISLNGLLLQAFKVILVGLKSRIQEYNSFLPHHMLGEEPSQWMLNTIGLLQAHHKGPLQNFRSP
ncbi:MAG: hypothetical protein SV598_14050, partial [Pseudomonadota bacterium]|nr:hypothetical protein [Pseudomonadota bacterium]